jgi:vacuolar-type H+-ATPase subunit H
LTARIIIIKNITSLRIPFWNLKYIINTYNPYVFLFANSYCSMSSRKEDKERKEKATYNPPSQDITPTESVTTTTTTSSSSSSSSNRGSSYNYGQRREGEEIEQRHSINRALEETKDNIRKATDEARSQIPRYTQSVNDYQEQTIQTAREIADNFLESQKEIINSLHAAWVPYAENMYERFYASYISPRRMTEAYARMVSSFADNMNTATRVANNMLFANMDAFKTSIQRARDNARELSRIGVNAAKTFEQTSRDDARIAGQNTSPSARVYVETEEERKRQF